MPERDNNMLKNIHEDKSTKLPFVIFESLRDAFYNNYYYRGEDCMKNLCKRLKECKTEIINYAKREILNRRRKNYVINKTFC